MSFIPSCDSEEDAIKSLANIYSVPGKEIERILSHPDVVEIAKSDIELLSPYFPAVISQLLKSSPRYELTFAAYYHSTSYNGCASWFDEGLLGSSAGIGRFIEKISMLIPEEKREAVVRESSRIVAYRSELEGSTAKGTGPYAWNTLTAASSSENGIRYQVPEAIQDLWGGSFVGHGNLIDLDGVIRENLKPVVVKFKGATSDLDTYCSVLWGYLLSESGETHLTHTFKGNGVAIPRESILAIIDL
ncbi:hypothetical protein [Pseudomonas chlororaphis]|uniref:hypothetical protein n=1 Tax=Pseudomonas chlororaphis TaxID=587753 RepID=UPI001CF263E2|nr:hypothetical protein [Pseudomonas chlororaphis]UCR87219.1 hypothetical protein K9V45_14330 [Pseudomonas chlororaphis]